MKKIEDNCFNEFDPNAVTVDDAIKKILRKIKSLKQSHLLKRLI